MTVNTEYLDPNNKLIDEVTDWLCGSGNPDTAYPHKGRVKVTPEGAKSLDHILVVVPTAQSGRNLRLAIAKRFEGAGIIPPRIMQPAQLIVPKPVEGLREATSTETAAAFRQYVKKNKESVLRLNRLVRAEEFDDLAAGFSLLDQFEEIWRILAGRGLLMRDVSESGKNVLDDDVGDEKERWEQLAEFENGFFGYLASFGLVYPTKSIHDAKSSALILPDEIEETVLPALCDPIRVLEDVLKQQIKAGKKVTTLLHASPEDRDGFDEWGRPKSLFWTGKNRPVLPQMTDSDIISTSDFDSLARTLAADYPSADAGRELPALALCDSDLFGGVAGAFLARKYVVHNPERHMLLQSSLGRIIRSIILMYKEDALPWKEFVSMFRSDDVLSALELDDSSRANVLSGLDIAQNAYIPFEIPKGFKFPEDSDMRKCDKELFDLFREKGREVEKVLLNAEKERTLSDGIRLVLEWIFGGREISHGANEKEFRAAMDEVREFLIALDADFIVKSDIDVKEMKALALRQLSVAHYSLEPDTPDAVKTEGWLELGWSTADHIALAGFHEGKVPDSVVGHPFLPDKLRKELGLVSNDDRLARDTWLFKELLRSHDPHAIHAYVARTNNIGDICRPSRLLYLCDDSALFSRVKHLFGETHEERPNTIRMVDWPLRLPETTEVPASFSPSAIDTYVNCPFSYLLKYGLGMRPYREKLELEANDFGTLVHAALEMYAKDQISRGDDQFTDPRDIRRIFKDRIFPEIKRKFLNTTLNIELQLEALEGRLALFADVQADWAKNGWRIRETEFRIPKNTKVPGFDFGLHGTIDRVDENIDGASEKRWCIIDYKTWDEKKLSGHVYSSSVKSKKKTAHLDFARLFGFPLLKNKQNEDSRRMLSVQLPVYGHCFSVLEESASIELQCFCYLVLGENEKETGFVPLKDDEVKAGSDTAKAAVADIRKNIFWPPGPGDAWKYDFEGLFVEDPMKDLGESGWASRHSPEKEDGNG